MRRGAAWRPVGAAGAGPGGATTWTPAQRRSRPARRGRWREALEDGRGGPSGSTRRPPTPRRCSGPRSSAPAGSRRRTRCSSPLADAADAPPWALLTLARLRNAQGRWTESSELVRRAVDAAPEDRLLIYRAADVAPSRQLTVKWLQRYLELSEGDDPDRIEDAEGTLGVLRELGDRKVWIPVERPERVEPAAAPRLGRGRRRRWATC